MFKEKLKEVLKNEHITKYKLSKILGVSPQTINFWVAGINEPKISYIIKICKEFDISADYLLGLEEVESQRIKNYNQTYIGNNIEVNNK